MTVSTPPTCKVPVVVKTKPTVVTVPCGLSAVGRGKSTVNGVDNADLPVGDGVKCFLHVSIDAFFGGAS